MHALISKMQLATDEDLNDKTLDQLFSSGEVYELSELKELLKNSDKKSDINVESLLSTLVTRGKLLHKVIKNDKEQYHLYWTNCIGIVVPSSPSTPFISRPVNTDRRSTKRLTSSKFISPFLTKRQKVLDCGTIAQKLSFTSETSLEKESELELKKREQLMTSITEKEEKLRRLKIVQTYKSKHDLEELNTLTKKWRDVSQEAATQLFALSNHPEKSMKKLLDCLNIDCNTIHYSDEEDNFY